MKESQALVAVNYLLQGQARTQFDATKPMDSLDGGISYWPEAVQYLLRTYATNDAISGAVLDLQDVPQKAEESETRYSARLLDAEFRCGNVHDADGRITMFIDGLNPGIRALESRYRETERRMRRSRRDGITFLDIVQYAQNEGDAFRARFGGGRNAEHGGKRQVGISKPPTPPALSRAGQHRMMMTESSADSRQAMAENYAVGGESIHLMQGDWSSVPTAELPSTTETQTDDPESMMLTRGPYGRVPAPIIRGQEHSRHVRAGRPGWQVNVRGTLNLERPGGNLICHKCYEPNQIAPDCVVQLSIAESSRIIRNYDHFSAEEKQRVPADSYWKFRTLDEIVNTRARDLQNSEAAKTDAHQGGTVSKDNQEN